MRRAIALVVVIFISFQLRAQEDDVRKIITSAFYNRQIYDRIFIEYEKKGITTFMDGYKQGLRGAFVLPDTTLQNKISNLLDLVGTSHANERLFMTMTLISHPMGNVYVTSNILDPGILLWVDFDYIIIKRKTANIGFYTTSLDELDSLKDKYIRVKCELKKRQGRWKVKHLKISPIKFVKLY
jgi:hypothetical protein